MDFQSQVRIAVNLLLFPFFYPARRAYPTFREHFTVADSAVRDADLVVALGCSLRADGTASRPTRAIAERAASLYKEGRGKKIVLSGGNPVNGVSEGEAMLEVVTEHCGLGREEVLMDPLPREGYVGTFEQAKSLGRLFSELSARKVILVVQPQQLPRALWLFRRLFPSIEFHPVNPAEEYDPLSTQSRMHSAWRFRLWNVIAWGGLWRQI